MTRVVAALLAVVAVVGTFSIGISGVSAESSVPTLDPDARIVVITAPRLTWEQLNAEKPPNMMKLLEQSATAMSRPRTIGPATTPGEAYLSIGAGNRMTSNSQVDGAIVDINEQSALGNPVEVWERSTGLTATGVGFSLTKPNLDRINSSLKYGSESGALGTALRDANEPMAVIANADVELGEPNRRQAALAAIDDNGELFASTLNPSILTADRLAPFGMTYDNEVVTTVLDRYLREARVTLFELSDLERAEQFREFATFDHEDELYRRALARSDELVGQVLDRIDLTRDVVIFVAPTAPEPESELTVFGIAGSTFDQGWAKSATTRRSGYVAITDIAPTILGLLDIDAPDSMNDTRISSIASTDSLQSRVDSMIDSSHKALSRDHAFGPIAVTFVVGLVLLLMCAALCLARVTWLATPVRVLALWLLAILPGSFLLGLLPTGDAPVGTMMLLVFSAAGVLATIAWILGKDRGHMPPVLLVGLLWLVLAVDIATGGNLQINTMFGYSPIVAGRFAGFGNQAFSMFGISALLLGAAFVEHDNESNSASGQDSTHPSRSGRGLWTAIVLFTVTVILDGFPMWGSDVGGVLAFVPAGAISVMMFRGMKIRVRNIVVIGGATIAAISIVAALDLSRPSESRTHLGRFVAKFIDGQGIVILQRKLEANVSLLGAIWTWIIPVALIYLVYLTWRPHHTMEQLQQRHTQFRAFGISGLCLGVLAMLLNDSGISMPAMMLAIALCYVSYVSMNVERPRTSVEPTHVELAGSSV